MLALTVVSPVAGRPVRWAIFWRMASASFSRWMRFCIHLGGGELGLQLGDARIDTGLHAILLDLDEGAGVGVFFVECGDCALRS